MKNKKRSGGRKNENFRPILSSVEGCFFAKKPHHNSDDSIKTAIVFHFFFYRASLVSLSLPPKAKPLFETAGPRVFAGGEKARANERSPNRLESVTIFFCSTSRSDSEEEDKENCGQTLLEDGSMLDDYKSRWPFW